MPAPLATIHRRKATRLALSALVFVSVASGMFYISRVKESSAAFLSVINLPAGADVTTFLETQKGLRDLPMKDGLAIRPNPLKVPYKLTTSIRLANDRYRDFSFSVTGNSIHVLTDGFQAGDPVFVDVDGRAALENIPSDWSGKLELEAALPTYSKATRVCVRVKGRLETLGLCHAVPERRAS